MNSKFSLGDDPGTATATVTLAKGDGTANLEIGLQQPHKVIFKAENASLKFKDEAAGEFTGAICGSLGMILCII